MSQRRVKGVKANTNEYIETCRLCGETLVICKDIWLHESVSLSGSMHHEARPSLGVARIWAERGLAEQSDACEDVV